MIEIPILFEDSSILVVDKPFGIVVNRSITQFENNTVQDWVKGRWGEIGGISKLVSDEIGEMGEIENPEFCERNGIVHRLDKDTSGVLVIAKTPEAFVELQRQFKAREIEKEYLALVHGDMNKNSNSQNPIFNKISNSNNKEFIVNAPLGRNPRNRVKWAIVKDGRESVTAFSLISQFTNTYGDFSLIKCVPKTGRTHQIRVHLASMKMPIVGDALYAGKKRHKIDLEWCGRMFLHATKLVITNPETGLRNTFASGLPKDLLGVIGVIGGIGDIEKQYKMQKFKGVLPRRGSTP